MCSIDILIGFGFGISEGTLDRFTDADVPTSLFQFGHADDTFKKNGKLAGSDPLNAHLHIPKGERPHSNSGIGDRIEKGEMHTQSLGTPGNSIAITAQTNMPNSTKKEIPKVLRKRVIKRPFSFERSTF